MKLFGKKKTEEEIQQASKMVYMKAFFLAGLIVFGMTVLTYQSNRKAKLETAEVERVHQLPSSEELAEAVSKEKVQKEIQKEVRTNELYLTAKNRFDSVLGEASAAAEVAVDEGTNVVMDVVYENTIGAVIYNLIQNLPERQKEVIIKNICEE